MKIKRVVCCFLCTALIAGILAGCGDQANNEKLNETTPRDGDQVETVPKDSDQTGADEVPDATAEQELIIPDYVVVSTPFGYMQYSDQWAEFMKTEQQREGDVVSVFFTAVINDVEYALFTVTIGGTEGEPICLMTDSAGVQRNVYVHVEEIVDVSALTEGEQNRLYAMQEEINYIIQNIK